MQTLNTLSTPEEKLAALCKKYAELVSAPPFYTLPALGGWHIFNYPKLHYVLPMALNMLMGGEPSRAEMGKHQV